jgi:hypothetical protein
VEHTHIYIYIWTYDVKIHEDPWRSMKIPNSSSSMC